VYVQTRSSEFERDGEKRRAAEFAFVCDGNAFWRLSTAMRSTSGCTPRVELLSHLPVTDASIIEKDVADSDD
jgi:hypothetical protein